MVDHTSLTPDQPSVDGSPAIAAPPTICAFDCQDSASCDGRCQPPARDTRKCKWCRDGYELRDGSHWVVKSIIPARISIYECGA